MNCVTHFTVDVSCRSHRRAAAGFTLVEVLVALAITTLLITVLIGALYYVFRVEDTLRDEVIGREANLRAKAWFAGALQACLAEDKNSETAFQGNAQELRCETTAPISPRRQPIPLLIALTLSRDADGTTTLNYSEPGAVPKSQAAIASWPATAASFRFADFDGGELDYWPPNKPDAAVLPMYIELILKSAGNPDDTWLVAPRVDPWQPPVPKNPFATTAP